MVRKRPRLAEIFWSIALSCSRRRKLQVSIMPTKTDRDVSRGFHFQNDGTEPVICCLEPWADELKIGPGESCRFVLSGPAVGEPQMVWAPGRITIYAGEGSVGKLERTKQHSRHEMVAIPHDMSQFGNLTIPTK